MNIPSVFLFYTLKLFECQLYAIQVAAGDTVVLWKVSHWTHGGYILETKTTTKLERK